MNKHEREDDENFLLDDENTFRKSHETRQNFNRGTGASNWGQDFNRNYFDVENSSSEMAIIGDHDDNSEDSPLLIDDFYENSVEADFHCHHSLTSQEDPNAWKKLSSAAVFCGLFMIGEFIGGYIAGSLAVMTDAAHLFSDLIGFIISLLAIWVGKKPPTKNMTFGFYRSEVVGAVLSVLTIWLLAAVLSALAIHRLYHQDYAINADTMIAVSSLGLAVNIVMGAILHGVCHTHSHGLSQHQHSHSSSNINVRAAAVHVLGDLIQSAGVLTAAIIIKFAPSAKIADPICTLIFSVIVICTTVKVAKDSLWFLLQGSTVDTVKLKLDIQKIAGVKHIHSLHAWALSPGKNVVTVHLAVDQYCDRDLLLRKTTSTIQSQISVISCTIQIEAYNQELISLCNECQNLQW
ncbi:unnamed protein product [Phyllotreta striolata]|uniref:Zinc transporter 2-like protein n=1 Tax=Phyllotreta striolata TaxID=444603 RepID=A0A9N9TIU4_PHYSR|nr:unnamed protein product [Phyllotreta striolata]